MASDLMLTSCRVILHTHVYSPFHKTLPSSSLIMHLISVKFYEMGDKDFLPLEKNDIKMNGNVWKWMCKRLEARASNSNLSLLSNLYIFIIHTLVNESTFIQSVFRIRIRIQSDPYHWAGSGSTSGNVDLDPGTKKNRETRIQINQNYKNII